MLSLFKKRKLTQSQLFGLAAGGVLTESNYDPFDRINMSYGINSCKICLSDWWDVNSTFDLIKTIDWLFMEGHRFPLMESVLAIEEKNHCNEEVIFEDEKFAKFIFNNLYEIKRLGFISWDYSRIINIARWGFGAKYIKEDQAWKWIMKAAKKCKKSIRVGKILVMISYMVIECGRCNFHPCPTLQKLTKD